MDDAQNPSAQVANEELLLQGYVVAPSSKRLSVLYSLLKKSCYKKKKIMVFFSSCNSIDFHSALLRRMIKVDGDYYFYDIHGKQKWRQRRDNFSNFFLADKGILLCTGAVARGLEIPPNVDLVVQYDPPEDPKEYIHKINQMALTGSPKSRNVLHFLTPEELQFRKYLKAIKVPLKEYVINKKLDNVQSDLQDLVASNHSLKNLAKAAYRSYILLYKVHPMKNIFNVKMLDSKAVAASFCLSSPSPNVGEITKTLSELKWFQAEQTSQMES